MLDYAIVDFENRQNLKVYQETYSREEAANIVQMVNTGDCEVYYEIVGQRKLYRIICKQEKVTSNEPRQVSIPR